MKKFIILIKCIFSISLINAAFTDNVLVNTPQGLIPLPSLKKGDKVICYKDEKTITHKTITAVHKRKVDDIFKVTTHDGTVLHCCKDAQFFMPKTKEWQTVGTLTNKSWLLRQDMCGIKIKSIEKLSKPTDVFCITVDECSNFYVSEEGILVHNEFITGTILTIEFGGGAVITWFEGTTIATVGGAALGYWAYEIVKKITGVKVEDAKIDIGSKSTSAQPAHFGFLTQDNNVITNNSAYTAQLTAVSYNQSDNNTLFVHPDHYKHLLNSKGTPKNTHLPGVGSQSTGTNGKSITPPDNHVITTPIIEPDGPSVVVHPITESQEPTALITTITERQEPGVVITPITEPGGPKILSDPIPEKFDSPIVMQGKTPEQAAIDEILEGATFIEESQKTTQYGKPEGLNGVNNDFEKLKKLFPSSKVENKGDGMEMITLPDGTKIISRQKSSGNVPTLEIQNIPGNQRVIKLRYPPQETIPSLKGVIESEKSLLSNTLKTTVSTEVGTKQKERIAVLTSQIMKSNDTNAKTKQLQETLSKVGIDGSELKTLNNDTLSISLSSPEAQSLLKKVLDIGTTKLDPAIINTLTPEQLNSLIELFKSETLKNVPDASKIMNPTELKSFMEKVAQIGKNVSSNNVVIEKTTENISSLGLSKAQETLEKNSEKLATAGAGALLYCWGKIVIVVTSPIFIIAAPLIVIGGGMFMYCYYQHKTMIPSYFKEYDEHGTCLHGEDKKEFERNLIASKIILSKEQRRRIEVEYRYLMHFQRKAEALVGREKLHSRGPNGFSDSKEFIENLDDLSELRKYQYLSEKKGEKREVFEKKITDFFTQKRINQKSINSTFSNSKNETHYIINSKL